MGGTTKAPALKARFTSSTSLVITGDMPQSLSKVILRIIFSTKNPSQLDVVLKYVEMQEEHQRARTFQEEYREVLRKHGINFDERYVWD